MGCFSFLCKNCGNGINSSSMNGDYCALFVLKNGIKIEEMRGFYSSYGTVFKDENKKEELEWDMGWDNVCELIFNQNKENGILAYCGNCINTNNPLWEEETTRSEDDPEQGWSRVKFIKSDKNKSKQIFHKVYK